MTRWNVYKIALLFSSTIFIPTFLLARVTVHDWSGWWILGAIAAFIILITETLFAIFSIFME